MFCKKCKLHACAEFRIRLKARSAASMAAVAAADAEAAAAVTIAPATWIVAAWAESLEPRNVSRQQRPRKSKTAARPSQPCPEGLAVFGPFLYALRSRSGQTPG